MIVEQQNHKRAAIGLIPEDWEERKVGNFVDIKHGYGFKGDFFCKEPNENIVLTPGNFYIGGGFKSDKFKYTREDYPSGYILKEGEIIVTMTDLSKEGDTLGYSAKVPASNCFKYLHNQRLGLLRFKSNGILPDFLYWVLRTKKYNQFVVGSASGSTVKHTSPDRIKQFSFGVPSLTEQSHIANLLSSLDSKIELNQRMNRILEAVGQAVFKRWFVDFEFPNEEGKPYKSSGGEMIYDKILSKEIPASWTTRALNEISINFDSKRVPLSSREREKIKGVYPYYGAVGVVDYINQFLFDGTYLLMSEDGVYVINENGFPTLQLVRGRFWVNNHAHVLQGNGISTELLFLLVKNTNVRSIVTGAVQPKINQGNMNTLKFTIPDEKCKRVIENFANKIFTKIIRNSEQNQTLSQVRDNLLPKLMSGKIRVEIDNKMER